MRDREELASAFGELEALVRHTSRLPGFAAAQAEARRRRGNRIVWISGTLVVLMLAGLALVIPGWLLRDGPPVLQPSPSATASPTPSISPSETLGPAPNPGALADRLASPRLVNASLEVGTFGQGCPEGRVQFQQGQWQDGPATIVMGLGAVGDVNADGIDDLVVSMACNPIGVSLNERYRVFAYSSAGLGLLGRVGTALSDGGIPTQILVTEDGIVEIDRAVMEPFTPTSRIWREQWRWSGSAFALVDEIDIALDDAPDVEMVVTPTSVDLAPGTGSRTVRVTIHNRGSVAPTMPILLLASSIADLVLRADDIAGTLGRQGGRSAYGWSVIVRAPLPGEAVTVDLHLWATAAVPPGAGLRLAVYGNINTSALHPEPLQEVTVDFHPTM